MRAIQPFRHAAIKRHWDRFKYAKKKRELMMQILEESEQVAKDLLGEQFVSY